MRQQTFDKYALQTFFLTGLVTKTEPSPGTRSSAEICGWTGGGLPRHRTAVSLTSGYLGFCVPDAHQRVDNPQPVVEPYEVLRPALHAYLASLGLNQEQAEDIFQETFLRLMRHILRNGPEGNLRAWLFRVVARIKPLYKIRREPLPSFRTRETVSATAPRLDVTRRSHTPKYGRQSLPIPTLLPALRSTCKS